MAKTRSLPKGTGNYFYLQMNMFVNKTICPGRSSDRSGRFSRRDLVPDAYDQNQSQTVLSHARAGERSGYSGALREHSRRPDCERGVPPFESHHLGDLSNGPVPGAARLSRAVTKPRGISPDPSPLPARAGA